MFALQMIVMWLPTLKHLLTSILVFLPFWMYQMSIQTIAILDLDEALMILGPEVSDKSLNIWLNLMIVLMNSELMEILVFSIRYVIPIIFK